MQVLGGDVGEVEPGGAGVGAGARAEGVGDPAHLRDQDLPHDEVAAVVLDGVRGALLPGVLGGELGEQPGAVGVDEHPQTSRSAS